MQTKTRRKGLGLGSDRNPERHAAVVEHVSDPPAQTSRQRCFDHDTCTLPLLRPGLLPRWALSAMGKYHYDESGNMASMFVITFLSLVLIPLSLSFSPFSRGELASIALVTCPISPPISLRE